MTPTDESTLRCVHCLRPITENSDDHVFPASWYPDDTPQQVQRWKAPSCSACNGTLGKIEKELLLRLGICIDPATAQAAGISAKVLRSLGVGGAGKSEKERTLRAKTKARILRELIPYDDVKGNPGILPGFGPHAGFADEEQHAILVSHESLVAVAQKVVRGSEYVVARRYIEPPYTTRTFFADQTSEIVALFANAQNRNLGPGFQILRMAAAEDPNVVLYRGLIWGKFVFNTVIDIHRD